MRGILVTRIKAFWQPKPHPVTGDLLAPSERISWAIMGIYRRWSVFFALQALTIVWWTFPGVFPDGIIGWNAVWSDLAIIVEMMVGMAFLNQSMRDARVIRASLKELSEMHAEVRALLVEVHAATVTK